MNYLMNGDKYINLTFDYQSSSLNDFLFTFHFNFPNQESQHLFDKIKPYIHLSLQKGSSCANIAEEEKMQYKSCLIKNFALPAIYKLELASILSFCIKKETATSYEDLQMVEQSIKNTFYIHSILNELIAIAKNNRKSFNAKDYKKISINPLDNLVKKLKTYFDEEGMFLFNLIEDNPYTKFAKGTGFAVYYKGGFFSSTNTTGADLANAKLFQSLLQAQRYAVTNGFNHYAIVETNISFSKIVENHKEDISLLEDMIARKQKFEIEEELAKPYENLEELSQLLIGLTDPHIIKDTIVQHRTRTVKASKKVNKI